MMERKLAWIPKLVILVDNMSLLLEDYLVTENSGLS